jgi:hypothetical protein
MSRRSTLPNPSQNSFDAACDLLEDALTGGFRQELIDTLLTGGDESQALARLRSAMGAHTFHTPSGGLALRPLVRDFDRKTMKEGFQVLKDWDGRAARFRKEIVAVDMLDYYVHAGSEAAPVRQGMAVLLDYYFLYLLALLSLRAWDEGDPNQNLGRLETLLQALNGERGGGYPFLETVEGLLWIAISNYHPDDGAYDRLLEKVRSLDEERRMRFALIGSPVLGTHLRWGFEAYYKRDLNLLRRDNFADYPWLLFSLATLMDRYHEMREEGTSVEDRREVVLALLNGLTSDPPAFAGTLPPALAAHAEEQARFSRLYHRYREDLLEEFEPFRPSEERYSPIAFHFNFPHNALKAMVGMALTGWPLPRLPLESVFEDPEISEREGESPEALARILMEHSRANPEQIGSRRVMVMTYMPRTGLRRFRATVWGDPDPLAEGSRVGEGTEKVGEEVGVTSGNPLPQGSRGAEERTERLPGSPFQRGDTVEESELV